MASFWQQDYPQVRAELRGLSLCRQWPENPTTAEPPDARTPARADVSPTPCRR
ncbi:hypothetical protein O7607_00940 [Micromonospora sp. WMMA1949]|nr:ATP-dependent helicase C-terminal domain-containing protein [Micromonospora sp. WMMA1949]MCZ7424287.1 hypothetical protein [Micromonospora sp. WMMA1949]